MKVSLVGSSFSKSRRFVILLGRELSKKSMASVRLERNPFTNKS